VREQYQEVRSSQGAVRSKGPAALDPDSSEASGKIIAAALIHGRRTRRLISRSTASRTKVRTSSPSARHARILSKTPAPKLTRNLSGNSSFLPKKSPFRISVMLTPNAQYRIFGIRAMEARVTNFFQGQPVSIHFTGEDPFSLIGRVLQNIDASCAPLTNMWLVEVTEGASAGSRFGISGCALEAC
jgi:hypothetical protein